MHRKIAVGGLEAGAAPDRADPFRRPAGRAGDAVRTKLNNAQLILEKARQKKQHLPMTLLQTGLLRAAISLAGPGTDSAAIIEAIRPARAPGGAST